MSSLVIDKQSNYFQYRWVSGYLEKTLKLNVNRVSRFKLKEGFFIVLQVIVQCNSSVCSLVINNYRYLLELFHPFHLTLCVLSPIHCVQFSPIKGNCILSLHLLASHPIKTQQNVTSEELQVNCLPWKRLRLGDDWQCVYHNDWIQHQWCLIFYFGS